jgi:hypothetical protein
MDFSFPFSRSHLGWKVMAISLLGSASTYCLPRTDHRGLLENLRPTANQRFARTEKSSIFLYFSNSLRSFIEDPRVRDTSKMCSNRKIFDFPFMANTTFAA